MLENPPARALIADDSAQMRQLLTMMLKKLGITSITHAKDGEEALSLLTDGDFNLLLLDCVMPKVDGLEVLKKVRANPALSTLPIILVTANADASTVKAVIQPDKRADAVIVKPLSLKTLGGKIRAVLNAKADSPSQAVALAAPPLDFAAALTATPDAIAILDSYLTVRWLNPAFVAATGCTDQDAVGQPLAVCVKFDQSTIDINEIWRNVDKYSFWRERIVLIDKSGIAKPALTSLTMFHNDTNDEKGFIFTAILL